MEGWRLDICLSVSAYLSVSVCLRVCLSVCLNVGGSGVWWMRQYCALANMSKNLLNKCIDNFFVHVAYSMYSYAKCGFLISASSPTVLQYTLPTESIIETFTYRHREAEL
jgi:hypothetical protein